MLSLRDPCTSENGVVRRLSGPDETARRWLEGQGPLESVGSRELAPCSSLNLDFFPAVGHDQDKIQSVPAVTCPDHA